MSASKLATAPIAIVGFGALFPGRGDTIGFWRDIVEGVDTLSDVPPTHWLIDDYYDPDPTAPDRTYGKRGGFLSQTAFDPVAFGIPPAQLGSTDTAQLLALLVAQQVLAQVESTSREAINRERTSVLLGVASATELVVQMAGRLSRPAWIKGMREAGVPEGLVLQAAEKIASNFPQWTEATFPGLLGNVVAGRIANRLDLGGSNYVTDAACASSLAALQAAMHELRAGESDLVLSGGVDTLNDILMYMCFSKTPALSPSGECRPFSKTADGTMLGEGIGIVALRRLEDAERDGNRIHAVIKGLGAGSDGKATAIYAPLPAGQARALGRAYEAAGYGPQTVELVEAHGTGTKAGDAAELAGLKAVFDPDGAARQPWCAIGSIKSQIGHTKAAAGTASLIKTVMSLSRKALPPTINVTEPADSLERSPFYVNTQARPWIRGGDFPRRASVSSFGFGGSNFHVTLEEYTGTRAAVPPRIASAELALFSGEDPVRLAAEIEAAANEVEDEDALARIATASHGRFDPNALCRASIVAGDPGQFADRCARLAGALRFRRTHEMPPIQGVAVSTARGEAGKIAFLFPGQGSQYVGMGRSLALTFPEARRAWERAFRHPATGPMRLHDLAFPPTAFTGEEAREQSERLMAVQNAQPAIAAASLAALSVLASAGIKPDCAAGHSSGEVMALHCGGVLNADDALGLACTRARNMAEAATARNGAMLAVQCSAEQLRPHLDAIGDLVLANDNAPSQVVASGSTDAIRTLAERLVDAGLTTRQLSVASAFHSPLVAGAVGPFFAMLDGVPFSEATIPVYANTSAEPYPSARSERRSLLASQIENPVRFREIIESMYADGVRTFIEVGPGSVLTGLVGKILPGKDVQNIALDGKGMDGVAAFLGGIGRLCVAGHRVNLAGLFEGLPPPPPKPARAKHAVDLLGANYEKPYPPQGGAATFPLSDPDGHPGPAEIPEPGGASTLARTSTETDPGELEMSGQNQYRDAAPLSQVYADIVSCHDKFLSSTAAAHSTFLATVSPLISPQKHVTRGVAASAPAVVPALAPRPTPTSTEPKLVASSAAIPTPAAPTAEDPIFVPPLAAVAGAAPSSVTATVSVTPPRAYAPTAPSTSNPPAASDRSGDIAELITAIVGEKTGYPAEMLDPDMDLEGELGVDSIKQVEILSELRTRMPDLSEIDPARMAELRTIRLIAEFVASDDRIEDGAEAKEGLASGSALEDVALPGTETSARLALATTALIREVIAEKTGYPTDMLEDDMDLEGELGVDSIKQVEILSELRTRMPDLPEIDPARMGELRTIRSIASFFG